jgi:hypothetical protein
MPRLAWSRLLVAPVALVALTVVSCFDEASECPTCPAVDSGRIVVEVKPDGLVDSVHVRVDGGPQVTVIKGRSHAFGNLSPGPHEVTIIRWFYIDQVLTSRTSALQIRLERGESRSITFHNDLPLVSWAPMPERGHGPGRRGHDPIAIRVG